MDTSGPDDAHPNAAQEVIAVTPDDEPIELVNRLTAHTGGGVRHRAFTCLVFDGEGRILLAQRAPNKRLWDGHWDGTVASHPVEGQSQEDATEQRLEEELGISPDQYDDLRVTDKFEYKRYYPNDALEREVCSALQSTLQDRPPDPDEEAVDGLMRAPYELLHQSPRLYRPHPLSP